MVANGLNHQFIHTYGCNLILTAPEFKLAVEESQTHPRDIWFTECECYFQLVDKMIFYLFLFEITRTQRIIFGNFYLNLS